MYMLNIYACQAYGPRLSQHNSQFEKPAGRIVNETGQKWELKTVIAVPDIYWAESAFWGETPFPLFYPCDGVEVEAAWS